MRRIVALALVYPLFILVLVGVLSWLVLSRWGPSLASAQSLQRAQPGPAFERVQHWLTPVGNWLWVVPLAVSVMAVAWWWSARRSAAAEPVWFARAVGWVPGAGRLLRLSRVATFAEVLALLVEQCVPLDQGLLLAASASGDAGLNRDARQLAMSLREGQSSLTEAERPRNGIPPLLRWSLAYDHRRADLAGALRQTARTYRRRAEDAAEWLQVYLPVILTAGIGGTVTVIYVACVMVPWYWLLESMPLTQGPF
jgi:type II secretory pathway component PulF